MLKIGTLNVRGCHSNHKLETLIQDFRKYKLDIIGITETHIPVSEELTESSEYTIFTVNKEKNIHHGVGIAVKKALNPIFMKLSDRICKTTVKIDSRKLHVISVYAPTTSYSKQHPEELEEIYNIITSEYRKIPNRDYFILCGDFNAKVGTKWYEYPDNLGRYSKGTVNNSGSLLLDFCAENDLVISNTLFKHKPAHITTWTAPFRNFEKNGTPRKNPIRNQIDFIITKIQHKRFIKDSRSYGGITTDTDHKLVITKFNINWHTLSKNNKTSAHVRSSLQYLETFLVPTLCAARN